MELLSIMITMNWLKITTSMRLSSVRPIILTRWLPLQRQEQESISTCKSLHHLQSQKEELLVTLFKKWVWYFRLEASSDHHTFRYAAELVRNGRIGHLKTVYVGLPGDPSGDEEPEMPIPENLNYDMWLGSTPKVYYTEKRVHPQTDYGRPGWLRCEQFGAGMITGWGSHHVDSAHWAMDTELTGPVEVWGKRNFPLKDCGMFMEFLNPKHCMQWCKDDCEQWVAPRN